MINKENIKKLVSAEIEGTDMVLVDIQISSSNNIRIVLDSIKGVTIEECVKISRFFESSFDRDEEDYQLEVSSYGIGQPLIIPIHYLKNLNKEIEVYLKNGSYQKGILKNVELLENKLDFIELTVNKKIQEEGKKKKTEVEEIIKIQNGEIQKAKLIPSF
jgi:ribosome maturation factor RimP